MMERSKQNTEIIILSKIQKNKIFQKFFLHDFLSSVCFIYTNKLVAIITTNTEFNGKYKKVTYVLGSKSEDIHVYLTI